ncbi:uncharacterized protein BCR38DRAFT_147679 [Pseudomassariella vexata]|uniref:Uncharacterized protein n=1 Tax=Pseudomassariella vexata TaxID=1141098 RepID=A0A1Y2D5R5_9PEZI|nr:uncharacterized protein BCR38DRAFT_147679 [Pseudomassariella vexata]ORY54547.1 hypothetical protein BCR38DRAFT_147679 [Pseudomassariella vexata]
MPLLLERIVALLLSSFPLLSVDLLIICSVQTASNMRCFATTSLALLSLRVASAFGEKFLYPTAGLTLHYLDTVNVEYQTTLYNPRLYTWCYNADNNIIREWLLTTAGPPRWIRRHGFYTAELHHWRSVLVQHKT